MEIKGINLMKMESKVNMNKSKSKDNCFDNILNKKTQINDDVSNSVENDNKKIIKDKKIVKIISKSNQSKKVSDENKVDDDSNKEEIKTEEDLVNKIADILGVDSIEIEAILNTLNIKVEDLSEFNNVNKFMQQFLNVDNEVDLMNVPDLLPKMKLINDITRLLHNQDNSNIVDENLTNNQEEGLVDIGDGDINIGVYKSSDKDSNANTNFTQESDDSNSNSRDLKDNSDNPVVERSSNELNLKQSHMQTIFDSELLNNTTKVGTSQITKNEQMQQLLENDIVNQVVDKIKVNIQNDTQEMTVQLKPDSLGKLTFTLASKEGVITANFIAENQHVKEAIESNIVHLKWTLQQQGINVDKMEVSVADNNFFARQDEQEQSKNNQQKSKKNSKMIIDRLNNKVDDVEVNNEDEQQSRSNGHSVHNIDYSA